MILPKCLTLKIFQKMKKYVLLIIFSLLSFGIKAQVYLVTDKEQFQQYTGKNKNNTLFKNYDQKYISNYVSKSSKDTELLIKINYPLGPEPGPCMPPPQFLYSIDDPQPIPPCPPVNFCINSQNLLSDKKFIFLPNVVVKDVMLFDSQNKTLSPLPHQITKQKNLKTLVFDKQADTMVHNINDYVIQFNVNDSVDKYYKIPVSTCGK